ncbi:hypothetical protein AOC36_05530 [Erysipelothrix larvae]|uniref:DUF948 domain-containing protein n=1 Tax=Erysipelothrix larvae TaxID=1514105 RepID=A0A0X8GZU0_9FIRM|nr:DUF948 domain-containing protein [Erysipelothrix larvae]AMC93457.1 hypothetical protein AOC36_05530 [Erysipelothrix larvae]
MDALLESLHDVSLLLLPFVGLICLIFLAILIYRLMVMVKPLPQTVERMNKTIDNLDKTVDTANELIDKLNEPMDAIVGVAQTVDKVNSAANGVVASVATYAIKNSDSLVNWGKDIFASNKKHSDKESDDQEVKEEDFGVYE